MSRPDFFIVGAPKCGTTAMYSYLRQHPEIFMPFVKEPHFFGADLSSRYGRYSRDQYLALFADALPSQRVGEASTWYLYSKVAAREIREFAPGAQIIIMLRNPVDVMHAQHSQLLYNRQENIPDFAQALAAEAERTLGRRLPPGPIRRENLLYREMAHFAEQVERYLAVFGRDRVHVVLFDDLRRDAAASYRATLRFLGVNEDFRPPLERVNVNKRVRLGWLQRFIYAPPAPLRGAIPFIRRFAFAHRLRSAILTLNATRAPRTQLPAELRGQLQAEFADEIEQLGRLISRDLSAWIQPEQQA